MYKEASAIAIAVLAFVNVESVGAQAADHQDGKRGRNAKLMIAPEVLQDAVVASDLEVVPDGGRVLAKGHNRVRLPATVD